MWTLDLQRGRLRTPEALNGDFFRFWSDLEFFVLTLSHLRRAAELARPSIGSALMELQRLEQLSDDKVCRDERSNIWVYMRQTSGICQGTSVRATLFDLAFQCRQRQPPRILCQALRPLVRHVRRIAVLVNEHFDAHVPQFLDTAVKRRMCCLRSVQKR